MKTQGQLKNKVIKKFLKICLAIIIEITLHQGLIRFKHFEIAYFWIKTSKQYFPH